MELINFKVGCKTISLKILDILLTERFNNNLTTLPNNNKSFIGVKDYMETPTPIFDLGIILNGESTDKSNKSVLHALLNWEEQQTNWFNSLELKLLNNTSLLSEYEAEQHEFESFYSDFKTDNDDLKLTMSRFEQPFKALVVTLKEAILSHNLGDKKHVKILINHAKRDIIIQLQRLFSSAKEQITLDYKPIIIFITNDGLTPYAGLLVDRVEDSIEYKKEDIKPLDKLTEVGFDIEPHTKSMMRGLVKLPNTHSILIDPNAIFNTEQPFTKKSHTS